MRLYPAIDLKGGQCVRLLHGDMEKATVYGKDPAAQAKAFADQGAEYIHVVDLDGAMDGVSRNADAVQSILRAVDVPVQLGGGIRDFAAVQQWLGLGVERVILGTAAIKNPELVRQAAQTFPGRVVIGIDARGGKVAVEGWAATTGIDAIDLARRMQTDGVAAIIYTDIGRDGAMQGPNLEDTLALADAVDLPIILSGGIGSLADLTAAASQGPGKLDGVICGRSLYEGAFTLAEGKAALRGESSANSDAA